MKICFLGTPEFAKNTLLNLIKHHEVVAVITQPDRKKGRKREIIYSSIKEIAMENNINIYQPEKIKDKEFIKNIYNIKADIFVVVAYGQILSKEILNIPKYGCINIHGSLLPKYRGAAPIQWSIIKGEKKTGITIIQMDEGMDTGDILLKKEIEILKDDNLETLYNKLSLLGSKEILKVLDEIESNNIKPIKQDNTKATYAPILKKELGHINWTKKSEEIINLVRGLNPWPGTYCNLDENNILKVLKCKKYNNFNINKNLICGEIIENNNNIGIVVKTEDGAIILEEIQLRGGKKMSSKDFLRGHKINKGAVLF